MENSTNGTERVIGKFDNGKFDKWKIRQMEPKG